MLDLDARLAQHLEASLSCRVRVERSRDDFCHPGGEHRVSARRRRAVMRARLHRHEERCALRPVAGRLQRDHLGVRLTFALMPAFTHHLAVANEDPADDRIRIRAAAAALRELQRAFEVHASSWRSRR